MNFFHMMTNLDKEVTALKALLGWYENIFFLLLIITLLQPNTHNLLNTVIQVLATGNSECQVLQVVQDTSNHRALILKITY